MKINCSASGDFFLNRVIIITISRCIEKKVWLMVNKASDVTCFLFVMGIVHVLKNFVRVLPNRHSAQLGIIDYLDNLLII